MPLLNRTHAVATTTQPRTKYVRQRSAPKLSVSTERSEAVVKGNTKRRSESLGEQRDTHENDKVGSWCIFHKTAHITIKKIDFVIVSCKRQVSLRVP